MTRFAAAVTLVLASLTGAAVGAQPAAMTLNLQNAAGLTAAQVEAAKETFRRIYEAAGIRPQWNTAEADVTLVIRSAPHPEVVRRFPHALGYALDTADERGRLAFVLADRTRAVASALGIAHDLVLGMTLAHEAAHLLLPYNSHSQSGMMRDDWARSDYEKARLGQLFFTQEQAALMRNALAGRQKGLP